MEIDQSGKKLIKIDRNISKWVKMNENEDFHQPANHQASEQSARQNRFEISVETYEPPAGKASSFHSRLVCDSSSTVALKTLRAADSRLAHARDLSRLTTLVSSSPADSCRVISFCTDFNWIPGAETGTEIITVLQRLTGRRCRAVLPSYFVRHHGILIDNFFSRF